MRKIALTLILMSVGSFGQQISVYSDGDASGISTVSLPKSNFCADLSLENDSILVSTKDTIKLDSVRPIEKIEKDSNKHMAKAQDEDNKVEEIIKEAATLISEALVGKASYYGHGDGFHGRKTASGVVYDKNGLTCAVPYKKGSKSPKYPFGTKLKVTNNDNGKSVIVTVTDTGSFGQKGRVVDLSYAAFKSIENPTKGVTSVSIVKI